MLSPWRLLWQWWLLRRLNENWKLFLWRDIFRSRIFCSLPHSHISSCWLQVRQRKQTGRRDVTVQHSRRSPNVNRSTTEWNRCPCSLQSRRTMCPVMHEHALPFTVRATTRHRIRPPGGDIETSPLRPPFPIPSPSEPSRLFVPIGKTCCRRRGRIADDIVHYIIRSVAEVPRYQFTPVSSTRRAGRRPRPTVRQWRTAEGRERSSLQSDFSSVHGLARPAEEFTSSSLSRDFR